MKVYKATDADMSCRLGRGKFQYILGEKAMAEASKCGNTGLHACEYILDCMRYYSLGIGSRYFIAEAEGDIAEDGENTRISCTELTLLTELDNRELARETMFYMIQHPKRDEWKRSGPMYMVAENEAWMNVKDGFAIARGMEPKVKGCEGAHIGWLREVEGKIVAAYMLTVQGPIKPDTWYTIETAQEAIRKESEDET